ncbi:MAG: 2-iminoacetate synthase ThiH [Candidatus Hydrogenedentes bacterium]|nr:2-iminoacetate synthase ThiH [Candidatus Hydrogenedentota bacterium]
MEHFSFDKIINEWSKERILEIYSQTTEEDVLDALKKERINIRDLIALLSPTAQKHLEKIAQKAHQITRLHFGRTISIYAPLYLSNHCASDCIYCFFSSHSGLREKRVTLNYEQIQEECKTLSNKGIQTVLLLTGDAPKIVPIEYIAKAVEIAKNYFSSIGLEIYAMDEEQYALMTNKGVEGVTLYMETYDKDTYDKVHLSGKKKDYFYRLHALERAGKAGIRKLTCGVLLGLSDWRCDLVWLALHASYLQKICWKSTVALSFPRLKHTPPRFKPPYPVNLQEFVQIIVSMRLFLPYSPFNLSTREPAEVRDNLIPLGITSMSAGSSTRPGGYKVYKETQDSQDKPVLMQFEIDDTRSVEEVVEAIKNKNYDPVWVDFDPGTLTISK